MGRRGCASSCFGSLHITSGGLGSPAMHARLDKDLTHYLTRPLGLEAVMRMRTSRGVTVHAFHGHFFVRSQVLSGLGARGGRAGGSCPCGCRGRISWRCPL
jgi:protein transport protein SEC24